MDSTGSARSDYEKFTEISRMMKLVAVEMNVPVLVLSQTTRSQRRDRRDEPEISDLRGSGALEEDAAAVMLLYEDPEDADAAQNEGEGMRYADGPLKTFLKLAKNRYGQKGRYFMLQHTKTCTRFDPYEDAQLSFGAKAGA
jgi:replicative DNA helicase